MQLSPPIQRPAEKTRVDPEEIRFTAHHRNEEGMSADMRLLDQLRSGDAEAGRRFVRDYYPGIYRYLHYLTGRREVAEDLAQETFVQAWRGLASFEGRSSLRAWLHRIAHREFLQSLRSQRPLVSLDEVGEERVSDSPDLAEVVDMRVILGKLPLGQRQVVALHYMEGYTSEEIAQILEAPVTTVNYRLLEARARLRRELGEGDLPYLNPSPTAVLRQWEWLPLEALTSLEARLSLVGGAQATQQETDTAFPLREPAEARPSRRDSAQAFRKGKQKMSDQTHSMSRRRLLEAAGTAAAAAATAGLTGAVGAAMPPNETDIIDDRLTRKVSLAVKATALSDLCEQLRSETKIDLAAGASVADEKVTLFCKKLPLRDVMRQLSRPFGYTWLRSGSPGEYRYELVQDLRSQLLEEELRNRDRNEALLALEREIEKYRPYLDLSPDEVLARARTAPPAEKQVLESLGGGREDRPGFAWGITQMYFRLTPQQLAALRAGKELAYAQEPTSGEEPLPPDVARGVLQSLRTWRVLKTDDGYAGADLDDPRGIPVSAVPEARALVNIKLSQTELGQFGIGGLVGYCGPKLYERGDYGPYAVGVSPRTVEAENAMLNAKLARDPVLQTPTTVEPRPAYTLSPDLVPHRPDSTDGTERPEPKVTTADVLEALHQATGMPIVADFYTRLYKPDAVSLKDRPLFDALNHLCDTMRLRWNKDASTGGTSAWLQFRSMTYYTDRPKEVPNWLLARWSTARREHGLLTLEDLVEIARLPDAQLQASSMAEGIREMWGLPEWDVARSWFVLDNLRFLAQLTPAQRQEVQSTSGLPFTKMTLAQQQAFFTRELPGQPELQSLEEIAGAALRVQYTQPGWFEWQPQGSFSLRWAVRPGPGREGQWLPVPEVRERTREAALEALRRIDPRIRDAVRRTALENAARVGMPATNLPSEEAQIVPTKLDLVTIYIPGTAKDRVIFWRQGQQSVSELD
jgi:RNA polymerase sigma-70 factor, ECF subfamily